MCNLINIFCQKNVLVSPQIPKFIKSFISEARCFHNVKLIDWHIADQFNLCFIRVNKVCISHTTFTQVWTNPPKYISGISLEIPRNMNVTGISLAKSSKNEQKEFKSKGISLIETSRVINCPTHRTLRTLVYIELLL